MNTAFQTILLPLAALTIIAADAHAGRWLSRDPVQEGSGFVQRDTTEKDGEPNLYCLAQNNPINFVDLFGLWTIKRDRSKSWADAIPDGPHDTIGSLAVKVRLNESEISKWLKGPNGIAIVNRNDPYCGVYKVPNTVVVYTSKKKWLQLNTDFGGGISFINQLRGLAESLGHSAEEKKYKVVWMLNASSVTDFGTAWSTDGIYKYIFAGHGSPDGFKADPNSDGEVNPGNIFPGPPYKLSAVYAFACYTASQYQTGWDAQTQTVTTSGWRQYVSQYGSFAGFSGSVGWFNINDQTVIDP